MAENERCERTDLLKDQCAHCRAEAEDANATYWNAKFEGVCKHPSCLQVIDVGDRVRWSPDGAAVIHARHKGA